jgi:putative redox protein
MRTTTVSARWTGEGLNYLGVDSRGHELLMGRDNITPGQLLLLASAGCMGMDMLHVLQKKHQDVTDIQIEVIGYQPEDYPKPYETVELKFIIKGNNVDPKAVNRAIELSREKYCVVNQTLMKNSAILTSFEIEESIPATA